MTGAGGEAKSEEGKQKAAGRKGRRYIGEMLSAELERGAK